MRNKGKAVLLSIFIIIYCAVILWSTVKICKGNSQDAELTLLSLLIGAASLPLTFYSTFILYNNIRNGRICTKTMAKIGAKLLAEKINSFQPTIIIYLDGNSDKLFKKYLASRITAGCRLLILSAAERNRLCPYNPNNIILTNKFFINPAPLASVSYRDRVIVFDDVTKTGETISKIKSYLIGTCRLRDTNILTCGFIVDKFGYATCSEPAFYYKKTEVLDNYHFPWRN